MKAPKTQILFLTAAVMFGAAVLRLTWIENPNTGEACRTAADSLPCISLFTLARAFHMFIPGWIGLAFGVLALAWPRLWTAGLALVFAGLALVFYNTDLGAGGFVLGLIALARSPADRSKTTHPAQQ